MPKSMASSDPLSSPSPSPPPPSTIPSRSGLTSANTTSNKSAARQLDTSSELSELTDEEVDGDKVIPFSEDEADGPDNPKGDATATRPTPKPSRRQASEPKWDWTYKRKRRKQLIEQDGDIEDDPEEEEEEEEEEQPAPQPHPMEEEEDEEEQPGIRRPVNAVRTPRSRDAVNDDAEEEEEEERDDDDVTPRRRRRVARAESLSDSGVDEDGDSEVGQDVEDDVLPPAPAAPTAAVKVATPDLTEDEDDPAAQEAEADDVESENETASEEEDPEAEEGAMDVDEDAPEPPPPSMNGAPTPVPAPSPAAPSTQVVASIMGAALVDDAPTPSASPSPSPPPEDAPDADVQEPEDVEAEDAEVEDEAADAETEADLQHEHRAEALDALATIELKFALLRERVYVEKMEALAWEEALVENGTHPESLHLHSELSRRRDKRIELAARRRNYEVANILKRRRAEENSVWSWWMLSRDELQTTMIADTNRKRRKLERDRRAAERPQPVLRLPPVPHEIPIPPTLHEIINKNPQGSSFGRRCKESLAPLHAYPSLPSLSLGEITHDLDYLLNHRWLPEPPPSRYDSFVPPVPPGMTVVLDGSPYGRPPPPAPPQRRRYPPGPSGLQHELEHGPGPFSRPLTPQPGTKVNGWVPNAGGPRPGESGYERDERDREDIEMERAKERDREMDYLMHRQQQQQQQQQLQLQYMMQQQPQQPQPGAPTRPIPHSRSDSHVGPGQGPALPPPQTHHPPSGHHHHHLHYHHVHHHHHNSSSAPPPPSQPQPSISPLHTPYDGPRLVPTRDLEPSRAPGSDAITLAASGAPLPPRQWEREREPPSPRYRERERDRDRERDRERERDRGRPVSGPPPTGPHERIMTPLSAPLPPSAPRPSRGSFSESVQPPQQPPPPPSPSQQQGGGTPLGSPVRPRTLPGRMVSPVPQLPAASQPAPVQVLLQVQGTMSPPKPQRKPPPPISPSSKPMDGERERVVLPLPLPPPPPPLALAPPMSPALAPHAHAHTHRLSLPPPLPQGQPQIQPPPPPPPPPTTVPPPPSVPVAAGEGA